jgi:hypothetical protein
MDIEPVKSVQNRAELAAMFPTGGVGAELGVLFGEFSRQLYAITRPSKLWLVDHWTLNSPNDWKPEARSWAEIYQSARGKMQPYRHVEFAVSSTLDWLKAQPDNSLDWLYLDADHSRDAVFAEITEARRVVKAGGIIAGHDYTLFPRDGHGNAYPCGVVEAVQDAIASGFGQLVGLTREQIGSFAIRNAPKPGKSIVIACSPRTGSNLLIGSLGTHPFALNAAELFNIPKFWSPRVRGLVHRGLDVIENCNLFKVFPYDCRHPGYERLMARAVVIYLYREDRDAQLRSWRKAAETGLWYSGQIEPHKVPYPEDAYATIEMGEQLFASRAVMSISYESLITEWEESIAAILKLAGWQDMPLGMALEKQS